MIHMIGVMCLVVGTFFSSVVVKNTRATVLDEEKKRASVRALCLNTAMLHAWIVAAPFL